MNSALDQLGDHVARSTAGSGDIRELLEFHFIDTAAAWIASTRTAEGRRLLRWRADMHAARADNSLSLDLCTRCALARLSEIDDIHLASMTTPGAIIIPGALTLAGALGEAPADDIAAAMLAGYEVMTRFGRAIGGPTALYRGIWPTYFAAPIGIAAVAARLLKLSADKSADALALALTLSAPGVGHHNAVTTSRWFAVGNAARNGLAAALTETLGEGSALAETSFKPWCAARQTMPATQALSEIIAAGVAPDAMDEIRVSVLPPHRKMIDHGVITGDRASYLTSVQYCMASAALAPDLLFQLASSSEPSTDMREFMQRIAVEADDRLLADYPRIWPARISVVAGSSRHERLVSHVPGDPARPFDRAQLRQKFLRFAGPVVGAEKAERLLGLCREVLASGRCHLLVQEIEAASTTSMPCPA